MTAKATQTFWFNFLLTATFSASKYPEKKKLSVGLGAVILIREQMRGAFVALALCGIFQNVNVYEANAQQDSDKLSLDKSIAVETENTDSKIADGAANQQKTKVDSSQQAAKSQRRLYQQRFDDWTYRCVLSSHANSSATNNSDDTSKKTGQNQECEISQSIEVVQDGNRLQVLNLAISKAKDKAGKVNWALVVLSPQDVHLSSDFGLVIGKKKPTIHRFRNCNKLGCWVVVPASNSIISGLKRANDGACVFRLLNGKVVRIVFSLKGFTKAFNELEAEKPIEIAQNQNLAGDE